MKKNIFFSLTGILCLFLFWCSSCKKDEPIGNKPYEKTNHIKAKINGVQWEACDDQWGMFGPTVSSQYFEGNYFDMTGLDICHNGAASIYLKIFNLNGIGVYPLGGSNQNYGSISLDPYRDSTGSLLLFRTDSIHKGTFNVKEFDLTTKQISGTFSFEGSHRDTNIVMTVTDGSFNKVNILVQ